MRGNHMVFRYPAVVRSTVTRDTLAQLGESGDPSPAFQDHNQPLQEAIMINRLSTVEGGYELPSVTIGPVLVPSRKFQWNGFFIVRIDDSVFVSYPMDVSSSASRNFGHMSPIVNGNWMRTALRDHEKGIDGPNMKCFSLSFVFDAVLLRRQDPSVLARFKRCVKWISTSLAREEIRVGYVSDQIRILDKMRERWLSLQGKDTAPSHEFLNSEFLSHSMLARELSTIYYDLLEKGQVQLYINNWVHVHLISSFPSPGNYPIRPYQTLLLLAPADTLVAGLPSGSSPALLRFIKATSPMKSFQQVAIESGISLSQIYRMAAHLVHWQRARIIIPLSEHSTIVHHPYVQIPHILGLKGAFKRRFRSFDILEMLDLFSMPEKFGKLVNNMPSHAQEKFMQAVVWLLRHDVLSQLYTVYYLHIGNADLEVWPECMHHQDEMKMDDVHDVYLASPIPLTKLESSFISRLDDDSDTFALFLRLCPYFRGTHHCEEILWRENIKREDFSLVVDAFSFYLITVTGDALLRQGQP